VSCNIKIIDEKKKYVRQNEKIFIFAASKNPPLANVGEIAQMVRVSCLRRQKDREGREFIK
jgi:hypothetical protein